MRRYTSSFSLLRPLRLRPALASVRGVLITLAIGGLVGPGAPGGPIAQAQTDGTSTPPPRADVVSAQDAYRQGVDLFGEGRFEEAIAAFQRAADGGYRPAGSMYNITCVHGVLGQGPQAAEWLQKAMDAGFRDYEQIADDPDLDPVRSDPTFRALLDRIRQEHPPLVVTEHLTTDPRRAPLVYDDLQNFVAAHAMLTEGADTVQILQTRYFDRGTPGLAMFVQKYDLTPERLTRAIRNHPEDYAALADMAGWLPEKAPAIRKAYADLARYIPTVVYPPTYFLVGTHRGIGSGSVEGQLITVERAARNPGKDWTPLLVHELVHFQQVVAVGYETYRQVFSRERSLLGLTIREGTAEFFTDLVTGRYTQEEARAYVLEREDQLLPRFEETMASRETGDWMWRTPSDPDQPAHIAYVIGARIVASYYERADDRDEAVRDVLSVTDYQGFFEESGYGARPDR